MSLGIIFLILIIHFVADFVLQTSWMSENKYKDSDALISHICVYTITWFLGCFLLINWVPFTAMQLTVFLLITAVSHFLTDYFTSKVVHRLFAKKDFHNGFVMIGFDQILHYVQLFLCIKFLFIQT